VAAKSLPQLDWSPIAWSGVVLSVSAIPMLLAAVWLRRTQSDLRAFARILSLSLGVVTLWNIGRCFPVSGAGAEARFLGESGMALRGKYRPVPVLSADSRELPDVYYIVLDGYAREDVVRNVFGHDNSEFADF